jgi:hypothetical protein
MTNYHEDREIFISDYFDTEIACDIDSDGDISISVKDENGTTWFVLLGVEDARSLSKQIRDTADKVELKQSKIDEQFRKVTQRG